MLALLACLRAFVCTRHDPGLKILALRQQLSALKRRHPRPRLHSVDRLFWITLLRLWSRWTGALTMVGPETVVGWHRAGFRLYWRLRRRGGRRKILHFDLISHPTAAWVVQRFRETSPDSARHRYVILDRDAKFSREVLDFLALSGIKPVRTSVRSPWQNGAAERWWAARAGIVSIT